MTGNNKNIDLLDKEIAIIGMGCVLPGARNLNQFWKNLLVGADLITEVPAERWIWQNYYDARGGIKNKTVSKWGGFVKPSTNLDSLFTTSYHSSLSIDKRLLFETIWQTLENAGYTSKELSRFKPAVIIGADLSDKITAELNKPSSQTFEHLIDKSSYMLSGFISQFFNWDGISFVVNTGQSSSLTAVHTACKYLLSGSAEVVLVGGINIVASPYPSIGFNQVLGLQAKNGRCKSFSNQADGFVRSEGSAAVILKPLASALRDKDNIWAVIKSSAANQGVDIKKSRIMPSYEVQKDLLERAYEQAHIPFDTLDLLEAHGSGTFLGDSVEFKALQSIFENHTTKKSFCALGSVKTNLGHLEGAGGLVGLIKSALCLKERCVTPNLHFKEPNRNISFEKSPFYWSDRLRFLKNKKGRAGISSFGLGGANVHVVIENFHYSLSPKRTDKILLFPISAADAYDLKDLIAEYITYIDKLQKEKSNVALADICCTSAFGREHLLFRVAITVTSLEELREKLQYIHENLSIKKNNKSFLLQVFKLLSQNNKRKKFDKQVQLYIKGQDIDWHKILVNVSYRKVNLPTYPFRDNTFQHKEKVERKHSKCLQGNDNLRNYLISLLANQLNCPVSEISLDDSFDSLGIESIATVKLVRELEKYLQKELPKTLFLDYPTLNDLLQSTDLKISTELVNKKISTAPEILKNKKKKDNESIAIIGMALRAPTANDIRDYWKLLEKGLNTISTIPKSRWNIAQYFDSDYSKFSTIYCKWGSFLSDIEYFDPLFFNMSPKEAEFLDPQQKLLLELAWEALEISGYGENHLANKKFGIFIGASYTHYLDFLQEIPENNYLALGNSNAIIANRISYALNLTGPSIVVDTLCSSSLVALHEAIKNLRSHECKAALVGAAHIGLSPRYYQRYCRLKALSPEGRCRSFAKKGDGFVPGEGGAVVVLKRLEDAKRDKDNILAVIKGSATNHGGQGSGLTVPSAKGQSELILSALSDAKIEADTISYIEAHGTGTELGDPIEVEGLNRAFSEHTERKQYCAIGSVKTNIGHTEPAAGLMGLAKVVLALQAKRLPPIVGLEEPNPHINFVDSPFYINDRLSDWHTEKGMPRRAGVSAFGIGGTNAHVILEEAPPRIDEKPKYSRSHEIFVLSARDKTALKSYAESMIKHFEKRKEDSLTDICYSSNRGKSVFEQRIAIIVKDKNEILEKLVQYIQEGSGLGLHIGQGKMSEKPKIAFLFTGQGSQYVGMGKRLYEEEPIFRKTLDQCAELLESYIDRPLLEIMFNEKNLIHETKYTQPALFALEYSLAFMLESWGIVAEGLLGHSLGEYVAACIAGSISLEDALTLVSARGCLMQELPSSGGMGVVFASQDEVRKLLKDHENKLVISGINAPNNITVSGEKESLETLCKVLTRRGIDFHLLQVSHAFHSPLIKASLSDLKQTAEKLSIQSPTRTLVSNLWGRAFREGEKPDSDYWIKQTSSAVLFEDGVRNLKARGCTVFVEIGPRSVLTRLTETTLQDSKCTYLSPLSAQENHLQDMVAKLFVIGTPIDWRAYFAEFAPKDLFLPTYPFQKQYSWHSTNSPISKCLKEDPKNNITFYKLAWKEIINRTVPISGSWFILSDSKELCLELSSIWERRDSIFSYIGQSDKKQGTNIYQCSMKDPIFLQDLITKYVIESKSRNIGLILTEDSTSNSVLFLECIYKISKIFESLSRQVEFIVIIEASDTNINESRYLKHSQLLGFLKILPYEINYLITAFIKVTKNFSTQECKRLLQHSFIDDEKNLEIEYLNRKIFFENLDAIKLSNNDYIIRSSKTYLITGGLGAIGREIASLISACPAITIILTGRTSLGEEQKALLQTLQHQAHTSTKIVYFSADISREKDVEVLLKMIRNRFGKLNGIMHAAGVIDKFSTSIQKSFDDFYNVGAGKVIGTSILWKTVKQNDLDFFLLFSSYSSLNGYLGAGFSGYAAANRFLNDFATLAHKSFPNKVKTIIWPAWKNIGMMQEINQTMAEAPFGITLPEGKKALKNVLENFDYLPPVTVVLGGNDQMNGRSFFTTNYIKNINCNIALANSTRDLSVKEVIKNQSNVTTYQKVNSSFNSEQLKKNENMNTHSTQITQQIIKKILYILSNLLKIEESKISENDHFSRLGVDSLVLMEIVKQLEKEFTMIVKPTELIENPTALSLAKYLVTKIGNTKNFQPLNIETSPVYNAHGKTIDADENKIAVVGISCILPGAACIEEFWQNLIEKKSFIKEFSEERLQLFADIDKKSAEMIKHARMRAGLLSNINNFDGKKFGFNSEDYRLLNPQQKLFLEVAQQAVHNAGYENKIANLTKTGVFVGARMNAYHSKELIDDGQDSLEKQAKKRLILLGQSQNFIATWVSDRLNLIGPSLVVDTACSSSLVAIHLACQSLKSKECEMALAGGVELLLDPYLLLLLKQSKTLSPDYQCHTFDRNANGYVPGEGAGCLLLKPLNNALLDKDRIYGVISGSHINNDGQTMGFTTPNIEAQQALLTTAYKNANINPRDLSYIETHGTGTAIGDPIELKALTEVFGSYSSDRGFCAIGSVKTNIGHLHSAAGVAGVIKTILSLHKQYLPVTLNCHTPNPRLEFEQTPFYPNVFNRKWSTTNGLRKASCSSFGFGGTNCHVIMEESPIVISKNQEIYESSTLGKVPKNVKIEQSQHVLLKECFKDEHNNINFSHIFDYNDTIITDHEVRGIRTLPGVTWLEMVRAAIELYQSDLSSLIFSDVQFYQPLKIFKGDKKKVVGRVTTSGDFTIEDGSTIYVTGLWKMGETISSALSKAVDINVAGDVQQGLAIYAKLRNLGYFHGPFFRNLEWLKAIDKKTIIAKLKRGKRSLAELNSFFTDPGILDSTTLLPFSTEIANLVQDTGEPFVPLTIGEVIINRSCVINDEYYAKALIHNWNDQVGRASFTLLTSEGKNLIEFKDLTFKKVLPLKKENKDIKQISSLLHFIDHKKKTILTKSNIHQGCYLVFFPNKTFIKQIRGILNSNCKVIVVNNSNDYAQVNSSEFTIDAKNIEHYLLLFKELRKKKLNPTKIIHAHVMEFGKEVEYEVQKDILSIESLFVLIQAMRNFDTTVQYRLLVIGIMGTFVTSGLWGLLRSIKREHQNWSCSGIELTDIGKSTDQDALHIIQELCSDVGFDIVHYQNNKRYGKVIREIPIDLLNKTEELLPYGAVCVITGGLGDLALEVARHLAKKYGARIALLSRTQIKARKDWEKVIQSPDTQPKLRNILLSLKELEFLGGEVLVHKADVTDEKEVRQALENVRLKWGPLHAIFHLAGINADKLIINSSLSELHKVIKPKLHASVLLDKLTMEDPLVYFVCFSSIVSVLGNLGQSCYSTANALLDAFAYSRSNNHAHPGITKVINWSAWQNQGMAKNLQDLEENLKDLQIESLSSKEAIEALEQSLKVKNTQVLVGKYSGIKEAKSEAPTTTITTRKKRKVVATNANKVFISWIAKAMKLTDNILQKDTYFLSLGLDSIKLVDLSHDIGKKLNIKLYPTVFFEHQTPGAFEVYLQDNFPDALKQINTTANMSNNKAEVKSSILNSDDTNAKKLFSQLQEVVSSLKKEINELKVKS